MISDKKIANAVSGKTARACDCCIKKRARWYCPADDAFLCQSCDSSVHSANSLARRHERVRLKTASLKPSGDLDLPTWHRGLTRKPRTPRGHLKTQSKSEEGTLMNVIVPELSMEDTTSPQDCETEEQLLYRVPTFDPFVTELRTSPDAYAYDDARSYELERGSDVGTTMFDDLKSSNPDEYMPSDLEEFAANVETLLGKGLDEESYGIEELGLLDCSPEIVNNNMNDNCTDAFVKEELELLGSEEDVLRGREIEDVNNNMIVIKEPFQLSFNYEEDDNKEIVMVEQSSVVNGLCKSKRDGQKENKEVVMKRRKILLSLDYDAISEAWSSNGCSSPWLNGQRPEINPEDCWPFCMGTCGPEVRHPIFVENQIGGNGDGGREARVSRYREKRRTRLFSKKIRYEVRKLNAEKRPRMKGRFVKRSSFVDAFPLLPNK